MRRRYLEPYGHFGEAVVVVGGGNSAVEAALELWCTGVEVTLVHRREAAKPTLKYWVRPDFEQRVEEDSIKARYETVVTGFRDGVVEVRGPAGGEILAADTAYVLIGYEPEAELERRCGVEVDRETAVPRFGRDLRVERAGPLHRRHSAGGPRPGQDLHRELPRARCPYRETPVPAAAPGAWRARPVCHGRRATGDRGHANC